MDQREEKQVQSKGEEEGMQTPHKRRVRYKGTHPRSYQEKYKELNPEKYKDTVERVIQKGGTPAGMHISICANEYPVDFFDIQPRADRSGRYPGIWRAHQKNAGKAAGTGAYLRAGRGIRFESEKTKKRLLDAGYGPDILTVRLMNFTADLSWQRRRAPLILFWQIWACLPCRLTTRREDLPINMRDLWICA